VFVRVTLTRQPSHLSTHSWLAQKPAYRLLWLPTQSLMICCDTLLCEHVEAFGAGKQPGRRWDTKGD
jgi:hypothetical protein